MSIDKSALIESYLDAIQTGITTLNTLMKPENDNSENQPILIASKVLIESFDSCLARMGSNYKKYYQEIVSSGTQMVNLLNQDYRTVLNNIKSIETELNKYKKDGEDISKPIEEYLERNHKEPKFYFKNNSNLGHKIDVNLINKYPGSYLWELYKNTTMWMDNGDIYIDHNDDNYDSILKYMKNDESLIEELKNMDVKKRNEFVNDLDFMALPVKIEYMNELCFDEDKMKMEAWKNRVIMVNDKNVPYLNMYLKKNGLFDNVFNKNNIENIKYFQKNNIICVIMNLKYDDFIEDYCKNGVMNGDLLVMLNLKYEDVVNEMKSIGIIVNENEIFEAWKKNRYIYINNQYKENMNNWIKRLDLFKDVYYDNKYEQVIEYNKNNNYMFIYVNMNFKYGDFIEDYCKNHKINEDLIIKEDNGNNYDDFENELMKIGIELKEEEKKNVMKCFSKFINISSIINDKQYDTKLQEWVGFQYQWKLIYKASEHNYSGKSFHQYCDDKGPTLIVIKSSEGWIFGGYTSKSWKKTTSDSYELKDDPNAFIFTLKNPHNIPPTKYNKRKESMCAINCYSNRGPAFCDGYNIFGNGYDIFINDNCNQSKKCSIYNDGTRGYECNSQYRKSLFVNTNGPDERNDFSVSDYEVYMIKNSLF